MGITDLFDFYPVHTNAKPGAGPGYRHFSFPLPPAANACSTSRLIAFALDGGLNLLQPVADLVEASMRAAIVELGPGRSGRTDRANDLIA